MTDPADIDVQLAFPASVQQHCDPIEQQWIRRAVAVRMAEPNTTEIERARLDRLRRAESDVDRAPNGGR